MANDMKDLYETNQDFHDYVNRYAVHYEMGRGIPVEEALTHQAVREYAEYLQEEQEIGR